MADAPKRDPKTGALVGAGIPKATAIKRDKQGRAILPKNAGVGSSKPKEKPKRWLSALVQDIEDFGRGLGPGLATLGKAAYNDVDALAGDLLPGNSARKNGFMFDDIAKGVGKDYVKRYKPLFTGQFGKFADQVAQHPLDFLLDAASIATVGAGAAVSGGVKAADASAKAARVAGRVVEAVEPRGFYKAAGFVPRTAENVAAAERVYGKASKEMRQGADAGVVRGTLRIGGEQGLDAKGRGLITLERAAKMNPVLRTRDAAVGKVLGHRVLERVPGIGTESRSAKETVRRPRLQADVRRQRMLGAPAQKLRGLTPHERAAWFFLHTRRKMPDGSYSGSPQDYAEALRSRIDNPDISDVDREAMIETAAAAESDAIVQAYENPSPKLVAAVRATKRLADEDMPDLLKQVSKYDDHALLERRMLQDRVYRGGEVRDAEELVPRADAIRDVAIGGAPRVPLRGVPDALSVPGRGPGAAPTTDAVEGLLNAEQRKLVQGRYKVARGSLKRWLAEFYDDVRYGGKPDANTIRRENALQATARGRARRKPGPGISRGELLDLIAKKGPWSRDVVRAVEDAGNMRNELWKLVRDERRSALRMFEARYPEGSLEAKLLDAGYNPDDPLANLADDRAMVDVIEEWMDEETGGQGVVDRAARGIDQTTDQDPGVMSQETAQALVDEARRLDGDLGTVDDYDVAQAIAGKYQRLSEPHDMPTRKEWVDRAFEAILRVHEDAPDAVDAGVELGKIRGSAGRALADKLGIRDGELGIEPGGQDWARALSEVARRHGFDDAYRFQAKALRGARQRYERDGLEAFDRAFDAKPTGRTELVDPETGRPFSDETSGMSLEEKKALVGGASYAPHKLDTKKGSFSTTPSMRPSTVTRGPQYRSKGATGRAFATGRVELSPVGLLEESAKLIRSAQSKDLYDATILRNGVDFDWETYQRTGGSQNWVVADKRGIPKLGAQLDATAAQIRQIGDLLSEEDATDLLRRMADMKSATDDLAKRGDAEHLVMIPRGYFEKVAGDMRESSKWAQMLIDRPLDVFRTLTLFLTGRYYVNNTVGQLFIGTVLDPLGLPGYVKFAAERGQIGAARKMYGEAVNDWTLEAAKVSRFLDKYAPELSGASQYNVEIRPGVNGWRQDWAMSDSNVKRRVAQVMGIPEAANDFGAMISDSILRQYRFWRLTMPHVKAARAAGETGSDADIAVRLMKSDQVLRDRLIDQTLGDLIDYRNMSRAERVHVRRVIPFYGWMRGITEWTARLAYDHPEALLALDQLSKVGQRENAEWNELVPTWLAGAVRIGPEKDGLQRVVNTQGLNPLSTISDVAAIGRGLVAEKADRTAVGGQVLGQINPFARAALAAINGGRDVGSHMPMLTPGQSLSGSSVQPQGVPGLAAAAAVGWLATTPQAMLVTQFRTARDNQETYGTPGSPNAVYQSPWSDYVKSYFGLPVRNVNVNAARNRRERDDALLAGEGRLFG